MDWEVILSDAVRSGIGPAAAIYALAAIGLNIHFGYTGLLNFGPVAFMLVGAYGVAVSVSTFGLSMWAGLAVGLACSVFLALLLGLPTLRLRAEYLAIATIAAGEILRLFYRSGWAEPVTGGAFGLQQFANEFYDVNPIPLDRYELGFNISYSSRDLWMIVVAWSLVALAVLLTFLLVRSPWGRVIKAVREDEDAVRSLGKSVYSYKLQSLVLGGAIGSVAGMLMAINTQSVHADSFNPVVTFYLYTLLVLGGAGTVLGPVVGSIVFWALLTFCESALNQAVSAGVIPSNVISGPDVGAVRLALVGLALVLLMVFRPQGILGNRKEMVLDVR